MLETVVYVSASVVPEPDLEAILASARRNNAANGVTGALLFAEGNFIQVLEGPKTAVDQTLARIRGDRRHRQLIEIYRETIETRNFPDWSMGCRIGEIDFAPADSFKLTRAALDKMHMSGNSDVIFSLLKSFYKAAYRHEPA